MPLERDQPWLRADEDGPIDPLGGALLMTSAVPRSPSRPATAARSASTATPAARPAAPCASASSARAGRRPVPGADLPRRPHLHRGDLPDQGRRRSRYAAAAGMMLVAPDTSPRGHDVPGEAESWDFGVGAGFYLDATQAPWSANWRMESYVAARAAGADRRQLPGRPRAPGHLRPLHGRPRRPHPGPAPPRPLALGLGLRPDLRAQPMPLGRQGVRAAISAPIALPGPSTTPASCCAAAAPCPSAPGRPGPGRQVPGRAAQARAAGGGSGRRPASA